MRNALELLLIASLSGSALGLAVMLLRKLSRKRTAPSFWYYLWMLVALRLLLPLEAPIAAFTIPTAASAPAVTAATGEDTWEAPEVLVPDSSPSPRQPLEEPEAATVAPPSRTAAGAFTPPRLTTVLFALWLAVAAGRLLAGVVGTIRFTRTVRSATKGREPSPRLQRLAAEAAALAGLSPAPGVHVLDGIGIPLQVGLRRPMVLLPEGEREDSEVRYILLHEFTHCKRRDILYKWLVQLMVCVHWFNPLVYLFRREISGDCELSCDAAVLRRLDAGEHRAYGEMLLASVPVSPQKRLPAGSVMLSEDAKALQGRLLQVAGYGRRAKPLAAVSAAMVVVLLACGFVAGPAREKDAAPIVPHRSPVQQMLGLNEPAEIAKDFVAYKPYGLTHSLEYNRLYYHGQLVRYFEDMESDTRYKRWAMPDGAVDVLAERDGDGNLVGVRQSSQAEFDARTATIDDYPHAYTYSVSVYNYNGPKDSEAVQPELGERLPGESDGDYYGRVYGAYYGQLYGASDPPQGLKDILAEAYEEYRPYGLAYDADEHRLFYEGKLVKFFSDLPDGGAGTSGNRYFGPYADGEVTVTARRNAVGALTGLDVKAAADGDGADIDWRDFSPQETGSAPPVQATAMGANRGTMTGSMPVDGARHIEIIAPTCQLAIEKSSGDSVEAVFSYPDEMEPNYTKYVELVVERPDADTIAVETRYDDHGFDLIDGMDIEEQMGYQPLLTVRIPDRQYDSLTLRIVASARDDVWDLPLDIRADTLNIRSVANNLRIIAGTVYDSVHIDNYAGELYFVTRQVGRELAIQNRVASVYLTLLEEPQDIAFDLSQVDTADIPAQWRSALKDDGYVKGAGTNTATVTNDMGTVKIMVQ